METDERLRWIELRISSCFKPRADELKQLFTSESNRSLMLDYLTNGGRPHIFIYQLNTTYHISYNSPETKEGKFLIILKVNIDAKITRENINTELLYLEWSANVLDHFELIVRYIYLPILSREQSSGLNCDKMMDLLQRIVILTQGTIGKTKGAIVLGLPNIEVLIEAGSFSYRRQAITHILETTLIGWIKQIKIWLSCTVEKCLKKRHEKNANPLDEIQFWKERLGTILSINEQLCSPQVIKILTTLEGTNSSFVQSFHNAKKDLSKEENDTLSNLHFLGTLEPYFKSIEMTYESKELVKTFRGLMHALLLVWTYSRYYHNPHNIHRMFTIISNMVVMKAKDIVRVNFLYDRQSNKLLRESLRICAEFRGCYLDAKDKADAINQLKITEQSEIREEQVGVTWHSTMYKSAKTPRGVGLFSKPKDNSEIEDTFWEDSPWPARNSLVFSPLNKFMERCNDVLELVEVTQQFEKIKMAAHQCGVGDINLNAQIVDVVNEFHEALMTFNKSVKDVLDLSKEQNFEVSFFKFHSKVRNLEEHFGQILLQSLKDNWDAKSKLRLLDVFEGITHRDILQNVLRQTLDSLLIHLEMEIKTTKVLLEDGYTVQCSHPQLSTVASQMLWLISLQGRVEALFNKLSAVAPMCFKGEQGWKLKDDYVNLNKSIAERKENFITEWVTSFDPDVLDELNEPVLIYSSEEGIFKVNLNSKLQLSLKEIYDLSTQQFEIKLPDEIKSKIENVDLLKVRSLAAQLFTATSRYTLMEKNLKGIEKALIEKFNEKAKKILEQGVHNFTWTNIKTEDYVQEVMYVVCTEYFKTAQTIQENYHVIEETINSWKLSTSELTTVDEHLWPFAFEEFDKKQKHIASEVNMKISSGCRRIAHLVQNTIKVVRISKATPEWIRYKSYIDDLVLNGLQQSIVISLKYIFNSMVANELQNDSKSSSILQVDIKLVGSVVYFVPPVDDSFAEKSITEYFAEWLQAILSRSDVLREVDFGSVNIVTDSIDVQELTTNIRNIVKQTSIDCKKLLDLFKDYTFLWKQDINTVFNEFLAGNITAINRLKSNINTPNQSRSVSQQSSGQSREVLSRNTQRGLQSRSSSHKGCKDNTSGRSQSANTVSSGLTSGIANMREKHIMNNSQMQVTRPTIEDFDTEIEVFQKAKNELSSASSVHKLGWIRVNIQPIKQTIETYASKWMYTYTKYLSDQVQDILKSLDEFLKNAEPEIEVTTGDDIISFMRLMRVFNEVNCQQTELDSKFAQMKKMIDVLEKYDQRLPEKTQIFYGAAPTRWNNLKMKITQAKQKLGPRIQAKQSDVTKVLLEFKSQCTEIKFEIEDSSMYNRNCDISLAFSLISQFHTEVNDIQQQAQDLQELQELLEKEVFDFNMIQGMKNELACLKQVWDIYKIIKDQQTEWKKHRWQKIKTKLLKRGLDAQYSMVMQLPDRVHCWDITLSMEEMINELLKKIAVLANIVSRKESTGSATPDVCDIVWTLTTGILTASCIPVMDDLGKASLRPRHWKQLSRTIGTSATLTNDELLRMNLQQFIQLGLQNHTEDVRNIVKRSSKDVYIENMLKLYEEVWLSKVFEIKKHTRLAPVLSIGSTSGSDFGGTESELNFTQNQSSPIKKTRSRMMSVTSLAHSVINDTDDDPDRFLVYDIDVVFDELHSHQLSLQQILMHPSAIAFLDDISKWQKTLQNIELFISNLTATQTIWVKLDEIFNSMEVRSLIPKESSLFGSASKEFVAIMKTINKNPNILQMSTKQNVLYRLEKIEATLQQCHTALLQHLDKRRHRNPFFLLLSAEETYSILCKGYDPSLICTHLSKLFQNLKNLVTKIAPGSHVYQIVGFESCDGEKVELVKPVLCENGVESWLGVLRASIQQTIEEHFKQLMGETEEALFTKSLQGETAGLSTPSTHLSTPGSEKKKLASRDRSEKSSVFNYLLRTVLPLSNKWSIDGVSDSVILSIKVLISNLLEQHYHQFISGSKDSLGVLCDTLNAAIVAISEFLFAQTKIIIRRKNLEKRDLQHSEVFNVKDISASLKNLESNEQNQVIIKTTNEQFRHQEKGSVHRDELEPYQVELLRNIIQVLAYEKDFIYSLVQMPDINTSSNPPYEWLIHPKYVWSISNSKTDDDVKIVCNESSWTYGYEYQGVSMYSQVSLENERSLHWLSCGLKQNDFGYLLGKNVHGSEVLLTSLACMIGRQVFVYNMTDEINTASLTDVLKGACMTGSWICFKNLEEVPEVLCGLLATCLTNIQSALLNNQQSCILHRDDVNLLPSTRLFALSHRNQFVHLPNTVKPLFRIVAYTSPSTLKLLEIGLIKSGMLLTIKLIPKIYSFLITLSGTFEIFSHGFGERSIKELVSCIQLNFKEILKWRDALKIAKELSSVTEITGNAEWNVEARNNKTGDEVFGETEFLNSEDIIEVPEEQERGDLHEDDKVAFIQELQYKAIILALYEMYTPSLPSPSNTCLFEYLLSDTFRELDVGQFLEENIRNRESRALSVKLDVNDEFEEGMEKALDSIFRAIDIVCHMRGFTEELTSKVVQIAELERICSMVCVVGANKHLTWTAIDCFIASHKKFNKKTKVDIISPMSVEQKHMFGYYNKKTKMWKNGALVNMVQSLKDEESKHIIVIDGRLHKEQVVFFCEMLTGKVALANGDVLDVPSNAKFIMQIKEHEDIPSELKTNAGFVCMDGFDAPWLHLLKQWVSRKHQLSRDHLTELCSMYTSETLKYLQKYFEKFTKEERVCKEYRIVFTMLKMFDCLSGHVSISSDCDNYMNYAAFWTFFGLVSMDERIEFSDWWREKWSHDIYFPDQNEIWNYIVNPESHLFHDVYDFHATDEDSNFIQDGMYLSVSYLVTAMIDNATSIVLCGPSGTGKTSLFRDEYLHNKPEGTDITVLMIHADEFLTCQSLWQQLNDVLEWKHSNFYQPIGNKKLVCFIKDMQNFQGPSSPVLNLLQQLIKHQCAYNPYRGVVQHVEDITFVLTLNTTSPDDMKSEFFYNLFNFIPIINFPDVSTDDQVKIYKTLLELHFLTPSERSIIDIEVENDELDDIARMKQNEKVTRIKALLHMLVQITVELQESTKKMFLKTPERFHYVFTMRTLKRIFSQICLTLPLGSSESEIIKVWYYEVHWAYFYHFTDDVDKDRWKQVLNMAAKKRMNQQQMEILEQEVPVLTDITITDVSEKISSTSLSNEQPKVFQYNYSITQLQQYLKACLSEYNKGNPLIKIYFYEETTRILFRFLQVLQSPFSTGHVMLVPEGSPDITSSWIKLACSIANLELFSVNPSTISYERSYDIELFKSDLVACLIKSGIKKEKLVLAITSLEIVDEKMLVLIDELLQKGTMSHIFNEEDKSSVVNTIRTSGDQEKARLSRNEAWEVFVKNVHENLRVFVSLTSMDERFERLCLKHPTMITSMQMICLPSWSHDQLVSNAKFILQELANFSPPEQEDLAYLFAALHTELQRQDQVHVLGSHRNISNTNYELLVERFVILFKAKQSQLTSKRFKIEETLCTINESMQSVTSLKKNLEHEEIVVTQKRQGCSTLLTQIGQDRAITEEHRRLVRKTKYKRNELKKLIPQYEEAHKRAIFKAAAIVKETNEILGKLDDKELSDLRSLQKPDSEIEDLLAAIIIIVKSPSADLTWNRGAKRIMANIERFKEDLSSFDDSELPEGTLQVLRPYIGKPHFTPGYLEERTQNGAIGSLVLYVRGVVRYNSMMQSHVKPLHQKVNETKEHLSEVSEKLTNMEKKLKDLNNRLEALGVNYEDACIEKSKQNELVDNLSKLLERASQFEVVLNTFTTDWKFSLSNIEEDEKTLCGKIVLATVFSVYMGPYRESFRREMLLKHWPHCLRNQGKLVLRELKSDLLFPKLEREPIIEQQGSTSQTPASRQFERAIKEEKELRIENSTPDSSDSIDIAFDFPQYMIAISKYLVQEQTCQRWLTMGFTLIEIEALAIIMAPLRRVILCVDPMDKIKKLLPVIRQEDQELVEIDISQRDANLINTLERAISSGSLVIVRNVDDELDEIFHSLIFLPLSSSCDSAGKQIIKFNGHRLQYNRNFRLVISSRLIRPRFSCEFSSLCSLINLTPIDDTAVEELSYTMTYMTKPELLLRAQQLLYMAFESERLLRSLDAYIMGDIQEHAKSYELWNKTNKLQELITKQVKLREVIEKVGVEYSQIFSYIYQKHDSYFREIYKLHELQRSVQTLDTHYRFSFHQFLSSFESFVKKLHIGETGNVSDTISPFFIYNAVENKDDLNKPIFNYTPKPIEPIKMVIRTIVGEFQNEVLLKTKMVLSRDHFEVFLLAYIFSMKLHGEKHLDENVLKILLFDEGFYRKFDNGNNTLGDSYNPSDIKQPEWLDKPHFNRLLIFRQWYHSFDRVVQILSQQSSLLKCWYEKHQPELITVPYIPGPVPSDLEELRLITVKAIRPDRFYLALRKWSTKYLEDFWDIFMDQLRCLDPSRPILFIADDEQIEAMSLIKNLAQFENIDVISADEERYIDEALTSAVHKDTFIVIQDAHLIHRDTLSSLYNRLTRLNKQYDENSKWRFFFISKDSHNIDEPLLKLCHVISLSSLIKDEIEDRSTWTSVLFDEILKSMKKIPEDLWGRVQNHVLNIRVTVFSMCVLDGYVKAYYGTCSTRASYETISSEGLVKAVQWVLGEMEKEDIVEDTLPLSTVSMLVEDVYSSLNHSSHIEALACNIVYDTVVRQQNAILIGSLEIPVPPMNVEPASYIIWFEDKFRKWLDENQGLVKEKVNETVLKQRNQEKSDTFLEQFATVWCCMHEQTYENFCCSRREKHQFHRQKLYENILKCKEGLVNNIRVICEDKNAFSKIGDKACERFLTKECQFIQKTLTDAHKTLRLLEKNISGGKSTIPSDHHDEALSLSRDCVPPDWLKKHLRHKRIELSDWLKGMNLAQKYLVEFHHDSKSLLSDGRSKNVLKFALFNDVRELVTILKHKKTTGSGNTMDDVILRLRISSTEHEETHIATYTLLCDDLLIQGASISNGIIVPRRSIGESIERLPLVSITAEIKSDTTQSTLDVPVFSDKTRQVCLFTVSMDITHGLLDFVYHNPAILLNI